MYHFGTALIYKVEVKIVIEIKQKQILIDGKPVIIMCGEIHYFRLDKADWQDRIVKLKEAGCNGVATYVPWICHEPIQGAVDLDGHTRAELDLGGFIDLCHDHELYFFLRPGPFIMAEMKNEGIPSWIHEKYPEIIPIGWDHASPTTPTLDYLAPNFLKEVRKWYEKIMAITKPRLYTNGGNIIAIQLDNEIGMLSWVSNTPDLTDQLITDFSRWLQQKYTPQQLIERYPFPLKSTDADICPNIRSPKEEYVAALHLDLGYYMRNRFARYIKELRTYSEENGIKDIPFGVNIHGTGGGRGFTYPIGISQLYETYTQDSGYISGSDIYFRDLDMETFQDLYLINGFMDAVHNDDQPLTSVEFNCGDGNFGETYGGRTDVSAVDLKARMCIAQGNRLINYYLMAGGCNFRMNASLQDGNNRIATTGERHGFAAPIGPEGQLNYTYPRMARSIKTIMAVSDKIATMNEEYDNLAFAFIPDYYMTEYRYPKSEKMKAIYENIERHRSHGAWEIMARAMLLGGYRFTSIDIQNKALDGKTTPTLVMPSAKYLHRHIQEKLVSYVNNGGSLLIYGELPRFDIEGNDCTLLVDALGLTYKENLTDRHGQAGYYLSLTAKNWAAPRPEVRSHHAATFELSRGEELFTVYGKDDACGFDIPLGAGRVIAFNMAYRCDIDLFKTALEQLGSKAMLTHDFKDHGIFMTSTKNEVGERFIHVLNLDGFDKKFHIFDNDQSLLDGHLFELNSKEGIMIPIGVRFGEIEIKYSTAEILDVQATQIKFRLTQAQDRVKIETDVEILPHADYDIERDGRLSIIISNKHGKIDDQLIVYFRSNIKEAISI